MIAMHGPRRILETLVAAALIWLVGLVLYTSAGLQIRGNDEMLLTLFGFGFLAIVVVVALLLERRQ